MPKRSILIFSCFLWLSSCFYNSGVKCDGNCYTGYGTKKWNDGGYMKGNWSNGELYGQGMQRLGESTQFAGDTYVGGFGPGGYNGYGIYRGQARDFVYKGNWKNGKPDGYGEGVFGPKSANPMWSYKGQWVNGEKTGFGKMYLGTIGSHAGVEYVGTVVNGKLEGHGIYCLPDGSKYEGDFLNDYFEGEGTFTFNDSTKYKGTWHAGNNADFTKVLDEHIKRANGRDSALVKYFYSDDQLTGKTIAALSPTKIYVSNKNVYFAKYLVLKRSSEPMKIVKNAAGKFAFTFFRDHINIKKDTKVESELIVDTVLYRDEVKYHLVDDQKRHFVLNLVIDDELKKRGQAEIMLMECDQYKVPISFYQISCDKRKN